MEKKFLILKLNEQYFAIDLRYAREIIRYTQPTKVPNAPRFFEGLIHLRGFFLPVIDTKALLSLEDTKEVNQKKQKILIVSIQKRIVGLKNDDIEDILAVDPSLILPAPTLVSNLQHNFFSGGFNLNDRVIMILDLERIFSEYILPHKISTKELRT